MYRAACVGAYDLWYAMARSANLSYKNIFLGTTVFAYRIPGRGQAGSKKCSDSVLRTPCTLCPFCSP